jgi:hypothetical protein
MPMKTAAEKHVRDILSLAMMHDDLHRAVIVYDDQCELASILAQAYRTCLPHAQFIHYVEESPKDILRAFDPLNASDLVVLIQSASFRLGAFRIRVDLFARGIKVIEHPHLATMLPEEIPAYIDSLAYDPVYLRGIGHALKTRLDTAAGAILDSGGEELMFKSGFESAKLNVGDYSQTKNVGGQFPIGEVFTEARELTAVNGRVRIFAFGDTTFKVNKPAKPITLVIRDGKVVEAVDSTAEFDQVLANIRRDETDVWVRELGLGLNRALTPDRIVTDIGTYERMCGVHLSLGAKHTIYKKPTFSRSQARHHVDVFAVTENMWLDDKIVYQDGAWQA